MASASSCKQPHDHTRDCPICSDGFTDRRVLPCGHTYCLRCIATWAVDKEPGDTVTCPLCRRDVTIPSDGVAGLPKNLFVVSVLHLRGLTQVSGHSTPCDVCSRRGEKSTLPGKWFCEECNQKMCDNCQPYHRAMKASSQHAVVQLSLQPRGRHVRDKPADPTRQLTSRTKSPCLAGLFR